MTDRRLLGVYLNNHLSGAAAGVGLARRIARAHRRTAEEATLVKLADEVAEDRAALVEIMRGLGVPIRRYQVAAGWLFERVGRLKPNGRIVRTSPLSYLVELEGLRLGVAGKAAGWRTLRQAAATMPPLDDGWLAHLVARADDQVDVLERLRVGAAAELFGRA